MAVSRAAELLKDCIHPRQQWVLLLFWYLMRNAEHQLFAHQVSVMGNRCRSFRMFFLDVVVGIIYEDGNEDDRHRRYVCAGDNRDPAGFIFWSVGLRDVPVDCICARPYTTA